jgi:predicted dehydrogenase
VFHAPLISATPGLSLSVIGTTQADSAASAYPDARIVPDRLAAVRHPDTDLVVIATPNDSHAPLADAALRAGKHVVVDKPFTVTVAEASALVATASEAGRIVSVFQNRRWDSDYLGIAREIAMGRIGEVVEFRSEIGRYRPVVRDRWRERAGPGSGLWYDIGPHLVDQALMLFGPPETVHADLRITREGGTATDWFQVRLGYGPKRAVLGSSLTATEPPPRFIVRGTTGTITKRGGDSQEDQLVRGEAPGAPGWGHDPDPLVLVSEGSGAPIEIAAPPGNYLAYYSSLRDAIADEGEAPVTPVQATMVMEIIEAGIRSSSGSGPGIDLQHGVTT